MCAFSSLVPTMQVIALLSGGKDSCFNLMETVANGHTLTAVAGLLPEQGIGTQQSPRSPKPSILQLTRFLSPPGLPAR